MAPPPTGLRAFALALGVVHVWGCGDDAAGSGGSPAAASSSSSPASTGSTSTSASTSGQGEGGVTTSASGSGGAGGETSGPGRGGAGGGAASDCGMVEAGLQPEGPADWIVFQGADGDLVAVNLLADPLVAERLDASASSTINAWSPDGATLAVSRGNTLQIWSMTDSRPRLVAEFPAIVGAVRGWNPAGGVVAIQSGLDLLLVEISTRSVQRFEGLGNQRVIWSADGRWILSYESDSTFFAIEVADLTNVVPIDPICTDFFGGYAATNESFFGDAGLICFDQNQEHWLVPLGEGATGDAVFLTESNQGITSDFAVIDDERVVYSGDGPDGVGVYAARFTTDGLVDQQMLDDGPTTVVRAGPRVFWHSFPDVTLLGVEIAPGPLGAPMTLGTFDSQLVAASPDGRWLLVADGAIDALDLARPVLHPDLFNFFGSILFAPGGADLFVRDHTSVEDEGTWSHLLLDPGGVLKTSLVESGQTGFAQARAATRLVLTDGRVYEVDGRTALERGPLPCADGAYDVRPQPPVESNRL